MTWGITNKRFLMSSINSSKPNKKNSCSNQLVQSKIMATITMEPIRRQVWEGEPSRASRSKANVKIQVGWWHTSCCRASKREWHLSTPLSADGKSRRATGQPSIESGQRSWPKKRASSSAWWDRNESSKAGSSVMVISVDVAQYYNLKSKHFMAVVRILWILLTVTMEDRRDQEAFPINDQSWRRPWQLLRQLTCSILNI